MATAENTALLQEFLGVDAETPKRNTEPALTGTIDVDRGLTQLERRLTGVDKGPVVTIRRPVEGPGSGIATAGEAFAEGAIQGGTFGFGEELTALARSQRVGRTATGAPIYGYREARDIERERLRKTKEAEPGAFLAGEITGGIATAAVPGLGAVRGAKLLPTVGKGLASGGMYGLGTSEADLTEGELGQAAIDVGKGALVGGGIAGGLGLIGKGARGIAGGLASRRAAKETARIAEEAAEEALEEGGEAALRPPKGIRGPAEPRLPPGATASERATAAAAAIEPPSLGEEFGERILQQSRKDLMREITGNVPGATTADATVAKRFGRLANLADELVPEDPELLRTLSNPSRAIDVLSKRVAAAGEHLKPGHAVLDEAAGKPLARKVLLGPIDDEIKRASMRLGNEAEINALKAMRAGVSKTLTARRGAGRFGITTQDIRDFATATLKDENQTLGSLSETTRFRLKEKLHRVTQDIYNKRLDDAAAAIDSEGGGAGARLVENLRAENKKMRFYLGAIDVMKNRLTKEQSGRRGLVEMLQQGGVTGLATRLTAGAAAGLERKGVRALARIIKAQRAGEKVAPSVIREAVAEGVPDKTIHAILGAPPGADIEAVLGAGRGGAQAAASGAAQIDNTELLRQFLAQ